MVKQFSARGVKLVASGTFRGNYILEYIRKIQGVKEKGFIHILLGSTDGAVVKEIGLVLAWCHM